VFDIFKENQTRGNKNQEKIPEKMGGNSYEKGIGIIFYQHICNGKCR
jgi:hypothetical protein